MTINWSQRIQDFEDDYAGVIEYTDQSTGAVEEDDTPRFRYLAQELHTRPRPHVSSSELYQIARSQFETATNNTAILANGDAGTTHRSSEAFGQNKTDAERIRELDVLDGVDVPIASAVLAAFEPDRFAVLDERRLRALPAADPDVVDVSNQAHIDYATALLEHRENRDVYEWYMDTVRDIATNSSLSPREVDMALLEHDRANPARI